MIEGCATVRERSCSIKLSKLAEQFNLPFEGDGDTLIEGEDSGVSFVAADPGRYFVDESTATAVVVVVRGTADVDQSVQSKVIVRFKSAAGELDLS